MDAIRRCRCFQRRPSTESYASESTFEEPKVRPMWQKVLIIIAIVILCIIFLLFLAIWVALPIAFMESISFQRFMMFLNVDRPKSPQFNNPEKYNIDGVVNFYITTLDPDNSTLVNVGSWLILPEDEITTFPERSHSNTSASYIVANTKKPVLLYLHGVACNRIERIETYKVVRKYFLVIGMDHRGYGDSGSNVHPSEAGIVSDTVQFFKWARSKTNNPIYVWGHSLGAALSTHTVRVLKEQNIVPMGLVLESPFTTMREEVVNHIFGKLFKWLAYFHQTILNPLDRNGFLFLSTTNIIFVDCPIMIMHAEDDNVIPYTLGKKLYEVATTNRSLDTQGTAIYHQFPSVGYKHIGIPQDPKVPQYIESVGIYIDKNVTSCRKSRAAGEYCNLHLRETVTVGNVDITYSDCLVIDKLDADLIVSGREFMQTCEEANKAIG